jgi:IS5 family transposase
VEATISHVKQKNRLGRNYLKGPEGDGINAILAACGHNLRLILRSISFLPQKIDGFLSELLEKLVALSGNRRNRVLRFA